MIIWTILGNEKDFNPTPPPPQTQCQQYLSCSWPDFNQTLKAGLWDQQQHEQQQQQQIQHLIYYLPNLGQTFKLGSWDEQQQQ